MRPIQVGFLLAVAASLVSAQGGPGARLVREVAIGDQAVPDGFTRMGAVAIGPGKRVYVAQPQDNAIRMFDSTGKFVRTIGGKGSGPGETNFMGQIGFVGDTLWTHDYMSHRFAFLLFDGTYVATLSPPALIDSTVKRRPISIHPSHPLRDGAIYYSSMSYGSTMDLDLKPPVQRSIATRDGRVLRAVAMTDSIGRGDFGYALEGRQSFTADPSFAPLVNRSPLVAIGGNGAWFAIAYRDRCSADTRFPVVRLSMSGDTLARVMMDCPRTTVQRGFVDSIVALNRELAMRLMPITAAYAESRIRPKIGDVKALTPIRGLQTGADGSVWMRPTVPGDSLETWIHVTAVAAQQTRFTLPTRASLKAVVDRTHVWVMQLDADDLPTLVLYRVTPR